MGFFSDFGGDIIGGALGLLGGERANSSAKSVARDANDFTEKMMKYRHTWEVADLKRAGLNPVLSAGGTPSMGSSAKADVINPMDSVTDAVSSALAVKRAKAEIENVRADTSLKRDTAEVARQNAALSATNTASAKAALAATLIEEKWNKGRLGKFFFAADRMIKSLSPFGSASAKHLSPPSPKGDFIINNN